MRNYCDEVAASRLYQHASPYRRILEGETFPALMDSIGKEGHSCLRQQKEEDVGQSGDQRWKTESCMILMNVLGPHRPGSQVQITLQLRLLEQLPYHYQNQ